MAEKLHPETEKLQQRFFDYLEHKKDGINEMFPEANKHALYTLLLNFYLEGALAGIKPMKEKIDQISELI